LLWLLEDGKGGRMLRLDPRPDKGGCPQPAPPPPPWMVPAVGGGM